MGKLKAQSPQVGEQSDPLSPYLFLFYTKGLISLLNQVEEEKEISGIKIWKGAPTINHLFSRDDSVIL